jgi:hypothetical protein
LPNKAEPEPEEEEEAWDLSSRGPPNSGTPDQAPESGAVRRQPSAFAKHDEEEEEEKPRPKAVSPPAGALRDDIDLDLSPD